MSTTKQPARPAGRPVQPDSLRQRLARGEARKLRLTLPDELARAVNIHAAKTDRTVSEVIADLVREHLVESSAPQSLSDAPN